MATPYIEITSGRHWLYLWDFSRVNNRHCVMCNACRAEYAEDALYVLAAYNSHKSNGIVRALHVYCCSTPPSHVSKSVVVRIRPPSLATIDPMIPSQAPQSDEPAAEPEREAPAVCRWCKGTREITINHKTKPCEECAKPDLPEPVDSPDGTCSAENIGRGWKVKRTFDTVA